MKVSNRDPSVRDAYVKQISQQQKEDAAAKPGVKSVEKADTVKISEEARTLQEAQKATENATDIEVKKVAEIKAQIEKGNYQINAPNIAKNMVNDAALNEILSSGRKSS